MTARDHAAVRGPNHLLMSETPLDIKAAVDAYRKMRGAAFSTEDLQRFLPFVGRTDDGVAALFRTSAPVENLAHRVWMSKAAYLGRVASLSTRPVKLADLNITDCAEYLRSQMSQSDGPSHVVNALRDRGITLIFVQPPKNSKIDGASFVLSTGLTVIALSLRFNRIDHFWFTLLHEFGHIALGHLNDENALLSLEGSNLELELEASKYATDFILPRSQYRTLVSRRTHSESDVLEDATRLDIHPALIAGRLWFENEYRFFSAFVNRFPVREMVKYD